MTLCYHFRWEDSTRPRSIYEPNQDPSWVRSLPNFVFVQLTGLAGAIPTTIWTLIPSRFKTGMNYQHNSRPLQITKPFFALRAASSSAFLRLASPPSAPQPAFPPIRLFFPQDRLYALLPYWFFLASLAGVFLLYSSELLREPSSPGRILLFDYETSASSIYFIWLLFGLK